MTALSYKTIVTWPNFLSALRLAAAPFAFATARAAHADLYRMLFLGAVATDLFDGLLARWLHQESEFGAKLDTVADVATYLVLYFSVLYLWPDLIRDVRGYLIAGFIIYGAAFALGLLKFRRVTAYHSWGGKLSALLMPTTLVLWFLTYLVWPFKIALAIALISGVEEIAITVWLPRWQANVPTFWHACARTKNK